MPARWTAISRTCTASSASSTRAWSRAWLTDAPLLEPDLLGHPGLSRPHVAGFDVVRGADGEMLVLEDNLRTPSGTTYAMAARRIADLRLPLVLPAREEMGTELRDLMLGMLRAAAPADLSEGQVVLLSDGPWNSAWWEHWQLARLLEIPLVLPEQLEVRRGRVRALLGGRSEVDVSVVYRRTDESRLRSADGRPTWLADDPARAAAQGQGRMREWLRDRSRR